MGVYETPLAPSVVHTSSAQLGVKLRFIALEYSKTKWKCFITPAFCLWKKSFQTFSRVLCQLFMNPIVTVNFVFINTCMVRKLINWSRWFPMSPITYGTLFQADEVTWVTQHIAVGFGKAGIKMLQFICPKQMQNLCSAFNISGTQTLYRQVSGSRVRCTIPKTKESIEYVDQYKTFQGSTQAKWTSILKGF